MMLEVYILPVPHTIRRPVKWHRLQDKTYQMPCQAAYEPNGNLYCGLMMQMLEEFPRILRLLQLKPRFPLRQLLKKLHWLHLHIVRALHLSRDQMMASLDEEVQLGQKKKRYCSVLRQMQWDDERPCVIDARGHVGSTARRYALKRSDQLARLQQELEHYQGWIEDMRRRF